MSNWGNVRSEGGKAGYQGGGNSSTGTFSGPDFNSLYLQKRSPTKNQSKDGRALRTSIKRVSWARCGDAGYQVLAVIRGLDTVVEVSEMATRRVTWKEYLRGVLL
ncbi:hypothetical protein M426DRAFT_22748 [Hypoxylon sp. CI-4A]|nr:hypothetical protein M426DRAFT_22748 [Hypoxylon sp. CI-4A]